MTEKGEYAVIGVNLLVLTPWDFNVYLFVSEDWWVTSRFIGYLFVSEDKTRLTYPTDYGHNIVMSLFIWGLGRKMPQLPDN